MEQVVRVGAGVGGKLGRHSGAKAGKARGGAERMRWRREDRVAAKCVGTLRRYGRAGCIAA